MERSKYFCCHPWVGIDITTQKEIRPCCKYNNSISNDLETYLESQELKDLKQQFLNGEKPEGCNRCWKDEEAGLESKRQLDWKYTFKQQEPDLDQLKVLSLPFGNSCNLACRTCGSHSSSTWITEEKKMGRAHIFKHQRYYQDQTFMNKIKELSNNLINIDFPGGEPFIAGIEEHLDYLDYLIEQGADNLRLHYTTNATIFPTQEFWQRWKKFKEVDIQLSIDGIEEQYEYLRWPAKWSSVLENIQKYKQYAVDNIKLSISHTVSLLNILEVPTFLEWCKSQELPDPYIGLVNRPYELNVCALPKQVKEQISSTVEIEKYLQQDINVDFKDSIKLIESVDQMRNENWREVFPKLSKLI